MSEIDEKKRFLVEFEIESHSCLEDGLDEQKLLIGDTEFWLSNLSTELGNEHPLLCLRIFLNAPDFKTAETTGGEKVKQFLHYLSFIISAPCRIHRMTKIVDWTSGLKDREAEIIITHRGHDLPYKIINHELLNTVKGVAGLHTGDVISQALKWHYYGVLSENTDEKLHHFWLALETLVQLDADSERVNDLCPKCQSPLYCEDCGTHPTHRPYPKQKIEKLFNSLNPESGQNIFDDASKVRNVISHGGDLDTFLAGKSIDFNDLVNALGTLSFTGLLITLQKHAALNQEENKFSFLQTNTFIKTTLFARQQVSFQTSDPDAPSLSDIPELNLTLEVRETE